MENTNGYSLSDIAAATGEGGFGGSWVLILLFAMIFGGNGFFGGNRGGINDYATAASQQDILFSSKFSDVLSAIGKIGDGICDSTYALNNAITGEGRSLQTQLAAVNSNIDNKFAALEKSQLEQRLAEQSAKINELQLNQALCGVMRYPTNAAYAYSLPAANCGCNGNI